MSGLLKFRLLGAGWAVLVGGLIVIADPVLLNWTLVCGILALAVGWGILAGLRGKLAPGASPGEALDEARLLSETGATLLRCSQAFGRQFDTMRGELLRAQQLISEATGTLIASFQVMTDQSRRQQALGLRVLDQNAGAGDDTDFSAVARQASENFGIFACSVVESAKLAKDLVRATDPVSGEVRDILGMLGEIESNSKQASLLALSGAKAAQDGEAVRGLASAADEVREISGRTVNLCQRIRARICCVQESIGNAEAAIHAIAFQDTNLVHDSWREVEKAMGRVAQKNVNIGEAVAEVQHIAEVMELSVGQSVTSLQFQDMLTQLIGHVSKRLDQLHEIVRDIEGASLLAASGATSDFASQCGERLRTHLGAVRTRLDALDDQTGNNPVQQGSLGSGEVVLF